jgi:hypothetical protein
MNKGKKIMKDDDKTQHLIQRLIQLVRDRQDDPISIRELAKKLRMNQKDVFSKCEDQDFCINIAIGIQGAGHVEYDNIGDYTVEDLSFDIHATHIPLVDKTILYTKRIHGCHECPSAYISCDKCLLMTRRNGTFVNEHRWPR